MADKVKYYKYKIQALLHDPPDKAIILRNDRTDGGHEERAKELISRVLGEQVQNIPEDVKSADRIASACDRISLPGGYTDYYTNFLSQPELRHPLSGNRIQLEKLELLDIKEIKSNVESAIDRILQAYNDEPDEETRLKKIYLSLWRELPDLLKQQESENYRLGILWDLLPADTRIPDHSIWDHQTVVSALTGSQVHQGNSSLLLFSLGPVQDFIAASRKTVDLWAGSYMLAWLSWKAMEVICDRYGPDSIMFPNLYKQPMIDLWLKDQFELKLFEIPDNFGLWLEIPSLPNRFMALVPDDEAEHIAKEIEQKVQDEMNNISGYVWEHKLTEKPNKNIWDNQLSNFLETYWTIVPFTYIKAQTKSDFESKFIEAYGNLLQWNNSSTKAILDAYENNNYGINSGTVYGRLYSLLEQSNGARKSLRNFSQNKEPGYRCSLIPSLSALIPDQPMEEVSPSEFREFWNTVAKGKEGLIKDNERLSAIAYCKRCFPKYLKNKLNEIKEDRQELSNVEIFDSYPSTHSIAGADYKLKVIRKLKQEDEYTGALHKTVKEFINAVDEYKKFLSGPPLSLSFPTDRPLQKLKEEALHCSGDSKFTSVSFCSINGEFLFEEGFTLDKEKERLSTLSQEQKDQYEALRRKAIQKLQQLYNAVDSGRPSKYYAILVFDGDKMGEWLSGQKAPCYRDALHEDIKEKIEIKQPDGWEPIISEQTKVKRPLAPAIHTAISRSLNTFTEKVRTIVEMEYLGKLIYAGGDDVMAMISIGDALDVSHKVRATFTGHIDQNNSISWNDSSGFVIDRSNKQHLKFQSMGSEASGSAGIGVVHYMYPLQQGVKITREAEQYAKNTLDRNAIAITASKRSGDTSTTGWKWHLRQTGDEALIPYLNRYAEYLQNGDISHSFVFDLESEVDGLKGFASDNGETYEAHEAVLKEGFRLFCRNSEKLKRSDSTTNDNQTEIWNHAIKPLFKNIPLEHLVSLLSTVQFMNRGEE